MGGFLADGGKRNAGSVLILESCPKEVVLKRLIEFLKEVRAEFGKVSWPGRTELTGSTAVVIVISLAVALFIGAVDLLLSRLLAIFLR